MSISRIKEIDFAQAYLGKAIPNVKSSKKYIAKDFILNLGDVKIKLSKNDTLQDVVRKVNSKSYLTGIKAKAVKGQLFLESTRKARGQSTGVLLKQQPSGDGMPLNANQIIADYLSSLKPKNIVAQTENAVKNEVDAWVDLMHLASLNKEEPTLVINAPHLTVINEVDANLENDSFEETTLYNELKQTTNLNCKNWFNNLSDEYQKTINRILKSNIKTYLKKYKNDKPNPTNIQIGIMKALSSWINATPIDRLYFLKKSSLEKYILT